MPLFKKNFFEYIQTLAKKYKIDGFVFDGPWPHLVYPRDENGNVICKFCEKSFRDKTGRELLLKEDLK